MRLGWLATVTASLIYGQTTTVPLKNLEPRHVRVESVDYLGRAATRLTAIDDKGVDDGARLALIPKTAFANGTIEVDLTGDAMPGMPETIRGFTGIAFRVDPAELKYECFYVRTLNGRSADQLQRNHSTQYISYPEFPWQRLRSETPGRYESYVDLEPGVWTKLKITVQGVKAQLFVNGAAQPALVVNDLKHGIGKGGIALWIGPGVVAHFADLRVTPAAD